VVEWFRACHLYLGSAVWIPTASKRNKSPFLLCKLCYP
jgi:hypothetical protein